LLSGFADLTLVWLAAWSLQKQVDSELQWALLGALFTSFVTRVPALAIFAGYLSVVLVAKLLSRRIWQAPILAMFGVTLLGTLLMHAEILAVLGLAGTPLPLRDVAGAVTLPTLILNLLLAIPVFAWSTDLAHWVYPEAETA
jgi:hypothetical protein